MLSKAMQDAINEQIKNELYSGYLYLAMAAQCEADNLPGFAHWMRLQTQEEISHAMKLFDFINERGGRVVLQAIDQPPTEFDSPTKIFEMTLGHEQKVNSAMRSRLRRLQRGHPARDTLRRCAPSSSSMTRPTRARSSTDCR